MGKSNELENLLSNQEALIKKMTSSNKPFPKSEDVLYVKEDKIFIQGLYQAMGINSEMRSRQRSHLKFVTSVKNLAILNEIVE